MAGRTEVAGAAEALERRSGDVGSRLRVAVSRTLAAASSAAAALARAGVDVPLPHRPEWLAAMHVPTPWFVSVRDEASRDQYAFAIEERPWRALPWHRTMRVHRFGASASSVAAYEAGMNVATILACRTQGVLRLNIGVFAIDARVRLALEGAAKRMGFVRENDASSYGETILISLERSEAELLASFHTTARQNIRTPARRGFVIEAIEDRAWSSRLEDLNRETLKRTGGRYTTPDLGLEIDFARSHPDLARVAGMFHEEPGGARRLVAFAIGHRHGELTTYESAASTRVSNGTKPPPMGHALVWDLMRWGRNHGAKWFDLGGVTTGHHAGADPVGGISDFKRFFSREVVTVGSEWTFEPRPVRARVAHAIGRWAARVRRALGR